MGKFPLIPRVRVNYTYRDILRALLISEKSHKYRNIILHKLQDIFDNKNIILTSSGRAGLYMILKSLPQKKVIIPAYTCNVVYEAIALANKQVIYAPTSSQTFNIIVDKLPHIDEDYIVIATHQYGIPCEIDKIAKICKSANAVLIEDCAGSLGTKYQNKLTGTFGDFAFFSFDASKLINIPSKGGFIIAKNAQLLSNINTAKLQSSSIRYKIKHLFRGLIYCSIKNKYIYRLFHYLTMGRTGKMHINKQLSSNIKFSDFYTHGLYEWQAAIGHRQILSIDKIIQKRDYIYRYFNNRILNKAIIKPPYIEEASCIRYTIQVNNQNDTYKYCLKNGIDMGFSFNHITTPIGFINEHAIANSILNVPFYYDLQQKEIDYIIKTLNNL